MIARKNVKHVVRFIPSFFDFLMEFSQLVLPLEPRSFHINNQQEFRLMAHF